MDVEGFNDDNSIDDKFEEVKKRLNLNNISIKENKESNDSIEVLNENEKISEKAVSDESNNSEKEFKIEEVNDKEIKKPEEGNDEKVDSSEIKDVTNEPNHLETKDEADKDIQEISPKIDVIAQDKNPEDKTEKKENSISDINSSGKEEQFVVFSLAEEEFCIGINEVFEITKLKEITRVPNTEDFVKGVINLRGRIHSVIDLSKKLDLPIKESDEASRIMIADTKADTIGLLVDSVKEVIKVSKKNIKDVPNMLDSNVHENFISNVLILGERLIIILNLSEIISAKEIEALKKAKEFVDN